MGTLHLVKTGHFQAKNFPCPPWGKTIGFQRPKINHQRDLRAAQDVRTQDTHTSGFYTSKDVWCRRGNEQIVRS